MPELPEVETICRILKDKLIGRTILGGRVELAKLIQEHTVSEFLAELRGACVQDVRRRGKYLLIQLNNGQVLAFHLRMTGQLVLEEESTTPGKATYLQLQLDNHQELRFRDQRKFGRVWLFSAGEIPSFLAKLGPEPLEDEFTVSSLKEHLGERQLAIKKALLNQELIAGLGNIYTDEALFIAGIHPARPVKSLSDSDWIKLHQAIRRVLQEGIDHRGTTKRDYRDAEGHPGSYQNQLKVYGRKGEPCVRCQTPIVKMNFGGRGTHFCPMCQE